jgi:hypothetical protein
MWMAIRAGAFALATMGAVCVTGIAPAAAENVVLTESKISQIKNVLQLSPAQEAHWRALMVTVRGVIDRQQGEEPAGLVQRVKSRVGSYVLNAAALHQISFAARPLIASLNEDQRRDGMQVVRAMGVAALF